MEGRRGGRAVRGPALPSGPRARSASPMRIRICFFPKIREKSADTVRPMAGPGGGGHRYGHGVQAGTGRPRGDGARQQEEEVQPPPPRVPARPTSLRTRPLRGPPPAPPPARLRGFDYSKN